MDDSSMPRSCPYPAVLAAYVTIIALVGVIAFSFFTWNGWFFIGSSLLGTGTAALVIEVRRGRPNSCPWLDFNGPERGAMYFALFLVGMFVVFPGVWPGRDVEWMFRIPVLLFTAAGIALLRIHRVVDHSAMEETGVHRAVYFLSRTPVYLLVSAAVLLVIGSMWELLRGNR